MATKSQLRAMKNQTVTTTSKVHRKKQEKPTKRHTKSQRTESSSNKSNCQISKLLQADSYLYIDARYTNLHHKGHPQVPTSAKKLGPAKISDQQAFILRQLSVMGSQKSKISRLLSSMDEMKDHFLFKLSRTTIMPVRY